MALNYIERNTTVNTFIDNYLDKSSGVPFDPNITFGGNPYSTSGYGCYAPVIKKALDRALAGTGYHAEVLNNVPLSTLCSQYIDNNIPVITWATMGMATPSNGNSWVYNGRTIQWIKPEHCLLLVGYDQNNYVFNDPQSTTPRTFYNKSAVQTAYAGMGSQAVVIVKDVAVTNYNGYSTEVNSATVSQTTLDKIQRAEDEYGSAPWYEWILMYDHCSDMYLAASAGSLAARIGGLDVASDLLDKFLSDTGGTYSNFPVKRMLEDNNNSFTQYSKMKSNMNGVIDAAEHIASQGKYVTFCQIDEGSDALSNSGSGSNWYLSLGQYRFWSKCTVYKSNNSYTATVTYNIRDYYDWEKENDYNNGLGIAASELWYLNYMGMAKNFHTEGSSTISLSWTDGQRADNGASITITN